MSLDARCSMLDTCTPTLGNALQPSTPTRAVPMAQQQLSRFGVQHRPEAGACTFIISGQRPLVLRRPAKHCLDLVRLVASLASCGYRRALILAFVYVHHLYAVPSDRRVERHSWNCRSKSGSRPRCLSSPCAAAQDFFSAGSFTTLGNTSRRTTQDLPSSMKKSFSLREALKGTQEQSRQGVQNGKVSWNMSRGTAAKQSPCTRKA
ncbi:uncharacterized protein LY89DRAFT_167529 [Mollisia scopiformis]|uniref:Uncharacterized protein n=1 Tax=Mollisia scopiformis TaxID=149040 RepID=A0A194XS36_MOLSC|nr:uncharacterized protein LY89DRAFT_167529 [Mollisia scopiformis]KUJ23110.1 hypothetical protein LY89DRAFT_167529 [Mollisia scopiformis]